MLLDGVSRGSRPDQPASNCHGRRLAARQNARVRSVISGARLRDVEKCPSPD
jgi:hypothetical protein